MGSDASCLAHQAIQCSWPYGTLISSPTTTPDTASRGPVSTLVLLRFDGRFCIVRAVDYSERPFVSPPMLLRKILLLSFIVSNILDPGWIDFQRIVRKYDHVGEFASSQAPLPVLLKKLIGTFHGGCVKGIVGRSWMCRANMREPGRLGPPEKAGGGR